MDASISSRIYEDCRTVKGRLLIYGCGSYGDVCYKILKSRQREIAGFIVSAVQADGQRFHGLPVYAYGQIVENLDGQDGIIAAYSGETEEKEKFFEGTKAKLMLYSDADFMKMMYWNFEQEGLFPIPEAHIMSRNIEPKSFSRILIVLVEKTFGDCIWASGFLRELRGNFPSSEITIVINPYMFEMIENCPYVDKILCYDAKIIGAELSLDLISRTKEYAEKNLHGFDIVFIPREMPVNVSDLWENYLLAVYSKSPVIIGHAFYTNEAERFIAEQFRPYLSKMVFHESGDHQANRRLDLLRLLNLSVKSKKMEVWFSEEALAVAEKMIQPVKKHQILVAVAMTASTGERSYNPQYFKIIIEELAKKNDIGFVLMGGTEASKGAGRLLTLEGICLDLTGKTSLSEAAAVIALIDIYLGVDTGLMHMAAAQEKPIVEISHSLPDARPTDPLTVERTGPWETEYIALRPLKALDGCTRYCRMRFPHCINEVKPQRVIEAMERFINRKGREV